MIKKSVKNIKNILQGKGIITVAQVLENAIILTAVHEKGRMKINGI